MDTRYFWRKSLGISVFVLYLNLFLFHKGGSVSYILQIFGGLGFLVYIFGFSGGKKPEWKLITGFTIFEILGSLVLLIRANSLVNTIYFLTNFALLGYLTYLFSTEIPFFRSLLELLLSPIYLFKSYVKCGSQLAAAVLSGEIPPAGKSANRLNKKLSDMKPVILGFVIAVPVIFILVTLLRLADPIYASYVNRLLDFIGRLFRGDLWNMLYQRGIFSFIFLIILSPFLLLGRKSEFRPPISLPKPDFLVTEMTVVMSLVAFILGSFLVIQWPYIFVKVAVETSLSKYGVATYSEYVKRGFWELLMVSIFVYGLVWIGLYVYRNRKTIKDKDIGNNGGKLTDKIFLLTNFIRNNNLLSMQVIVLAEFFLFILSIFRRIWLYQAYHGWSLGRLYGGILLVWITGLVLFVLLRHFMNKRFVVFESLFAIVILAFIGIFNAENFIVVNHPPTVNKRIDYIYLSRMSADGYEGWKRSFDYAKKH